MDKIGIISRIIWASANAIYVISVASTVAFLDSVNKRLILILKFNYLSSKISLT